MGDAYRVLYADWVGKSGIYSAVSERPCAFGRVRNPVVAQLENVVLVSFRGWATAEVGVPLMQGHNAIPQIIVVSRDGRIFKHFFGFSPAYASELRQALEAALN